MRASLALVLLSLLFLLQVAITTEDAFLDDAFISYRYARHLVEGDGLVFNPGERVEGYTNFSWVLLSSAVLVAGGQPATWMPMIGSLCGVATIVVVARAARRFAESEGRPHAYSGVPAAVVMAASTSFAFWSGTGLETSLFVLLMTVAGFALVEGAPLRFALAIGLAFLTRPEAALLGLVGVGWFALTRGGRAAAPPRRQLAALGLLLVIVVPYLAFKLAYFGHLLPNTRLAKPAVLADGISYVAWALVDLAGPLVVGVAAAASSARARGLVLLFALHAGAVALEGGDWMPFTRLLLPALGWLAAACDARFLRWAVFPRRRREIPGAVVAALSTLYVPQSLLDVAWVEDRGTVERDPEYVRWLAAMGAPPTRSVATFDVGLVGWLHPEWRIVDLAGLTDPELAAVPGGHYGRRLPADLLERRAPDAFLLALKSEQPLRCHYAVECNIAELPWFSEHFERKGLFVIGPSYALVWYQRSSRPRPP